MTLTAKGFVPITRVDTGRSYDVTIYHATGDGITNDTTAIQAAINACAAAGGGQVYFPKGTYKVTGLTITSSNVQLVGEGISSRIAMSSATGDTLIIGSTGQVSGVAIRNLQFKPSVARTSGREIRVDSFYVLWLTDLWFEDAYDCVKLGAAANLSVIVFMDNVRGWKYNRFLYLTRVYDGWFKGLSLDAAKLNAESIYIDGGCEGLTFSHLDAVNSLGTTSTSGSAVHILSAEYVTTPPREIVFTGCLLDSHYHAVKAESGYRNHFIGCWFQGYNYGVYTLGTATDYEFIGCDAARCGNNGYVLGANAGWKIIGGYVMNNGSVSSADGIAVGATSTGTLIDGTTFYNGSQPFDTGINQVYGIHLYGGAVNVIIQNVTVGQAGRLNATGGILIDATVDYFMLDKITARGYGGGNGLVNNAGTGATKVVGTVFQ